MRRLALLLPLCLLTGCATRYQVPDDTAATARLTVKHIRSRGLEGTVNNSATTVSLYSSPDCSPRSDLGRIARVGRGVLGASEEPVTASVKADARVYLSVDAMTQIWRGASNTTYWCTSLVSFVPEAGKAYTLSQDTTGSYLGVFNEKKCDVQLVDNQTGKPPSTLQGHNAVKECRSKGV